MEVQLHVLARVADLARDPAHRLVAEAEDVERLDVERGRDVAAAERVEQESEPVRPAVDLEVDGARSHGLGRRVGPEPAGAELRVDRYQNVRPHLFKLRRRVPATT